MLTGCATIPSTATLEALQRDAERLTPPRPAVGGDLPGKSALKSSGQSGGKLSSGRPRLADTSPPFIRSVSKSPANADDAVGRGPRRTDRIRLASADQEATTASDPPPIGTTLSDRLKIPDVLPGADAPPLLLPSTDQPEEQSRMIQKLFPEMPDLATDIRTEPAPDLPRYTREDLERIALDNNPLIAQAAADVEAALGAAIQAGAYPNPEVGYEADTVGSAGTRNYQGAFFSQQIVTAGKLDLARAIANVDLMNKQLALRKARAELLQNVRTAYFNVLVARENLKYSEALVRFTNEVFRIQVEQLKGGQTAAYEPSYLRAQAFVSRGAFVQAENTYKAAWKELAAWLGEPNFPAASLDGEVAVSGRPIDYEAALAYMMSNHTEVLGARNLEFQARLGVRLAEVTPVPDIKVYSAIQRDFTTPPVGRTTYNLQVGVPVPIFNQNRGGIRKAQGELVRATNELGRVRNELAGKLADAFSRYETNRTLLDYYRDQILPDQARVYRGVYERHQKVSDEVGFGDIIVAQQILVGYVATYVAAMDAQWDAYAEIAGLLQLEDLSEIPLADPTP